MWGTLLIVAVVVGVLFLIGVAVHFTHLEKVQNDCQDSLGNLRAHHDEMMRQIRRDLEAKFVKEAIELRAGIEERNQTIAAKCAEVASGAASLASLRELYAESETKLEKSHDDFVQMRAERNELLSEVEQLKDRLHQLLSAARAAREVLKGPCHETESTS